MLTNVELANQYIEAHDKGFVEDLEDNAECNSECDDCPAREACTQLSDGGEYKDFVANYKKLYPTIKEQLCI